MKPYKTTKDIDYRWHSALEAEPVLPNRTLIRNDEELLVCIECIDYSDAKTFGKKPLSFLRYDTAGVAEWSTFDGNVIEDFFAKWKREDDGYIERVIAWKYIEPFEIFAAD